MSSIDKRVVQMEFDNKQFEAGIQTSLKSLENLKKGLDLKGATEGIKNIEKSVSGFNLSGMSKAVDGIAQHFTWLGRTIDNELDRITSKAIASGEQMLKSLSVEQVGAGWTKYEDKTRSVATIMSATGKTVDQVNTSLEKLNWFTDETSYNFTDMVNNVGKFTSVGVDLDDAVTAMQGIANAAALSGGGVNEASRAMYNFSQAMGTGKLLLQDWKSIELANMATVDFKNALIESGLAMGTIVKQGEQYVTTTKDGTGAISSFKDANEGFRDSLSAGWITTEVMMDTFKKYGEYADEIYKITQEEGITAAEAMERFSNGTTTLGERAFKAAQEARTFTDAINATKDAVSTGWMQSFEIIFGNYEQAKVMWTDLANTLWDVFAGGAEARNELLRETFQEAKSIVSAEDWANIAKDIPFVDTFRKAILDAARDHGIAFEEMKTDEETFMNLLKEGQVTTDLLNSALGRTGESTSEASSGISDTSDKLEELEKVAKKVIRGDFGNGEDRVKALTEAGYDYKEVQTAVNQILKGQSITVGELSDAELKQLGYTEEQIEQLHKLKKIAEETGTPLNELINTMTKPTGRELMIESASNAFQALMMVIRAVKYAWKDVFPEMTADRLYNIIERVRDFTKSLIMNYDTADKVRRIFRGVFSVFDILGQALSSAVGFFGKLLEMLKPVGDWLLNTGAQIGDFWFSLSKSFRELGVFDHIADGLLKVLRTLSGKLKVIKTSILKQLDASGLLEPIKSTWANFMAWMDSKGGIVGLIDRFFNLVNEWVSNLNVSNVGAAIINFIKRIKDSFKGFSGLKDFVQSAFKTIFSFFGSIGPKLSGSLKKGTGSAVDWVTSFIKGIKDALSGIGDKLKGAFKLSGESIKNGFEWLSNTIDSVTSFVKEKITPILSLIRDILLLKTLSIINKLTKSISNIFNSVSGIIDGATGILKAFEKVVERFGNGMTKIMNAKARDLNADAVLKVAGAIAILVGSLYVLTKLDPNKIYDAISILAVLMGGLVLFIKSINSVSNTGTIKLSGFLGLAMGVFVLVKTMQSIAKMDIKDVIKSMAEVGALLLVLSAFTNLADSNFKASNGAALLLTAISLQAFVLAMIELAKMKPETAVKGLIGLGLLLTEVGIFTRIASKNIKFSNGSGLIAMAGSLLIFAQVMKQIGSMDFKTITKGLIGMGAALLEISIFTKSASGMSIGSGIGSILSLASLLILIPLFKELSKLSNIEKVGVGLGAGIAGIGIGIKALSSISPAGAAKAGANVAIFSAIIAGIVGVASLIGSIPGSVDFMDNGIALLGQIGSAIGAFIGGITSGLGEGLANGLGSIGQGLSDFWTNASTFIEGVKGISAADFSGVETLSGAVLKLTASEFLDALTKLVGGGEKNLETFGQQLSGLGPALYSFSSFAAQVDQGDISNAATALQSICDVTIPSSGGLLQKLIGEKSYANFGSQLGDLGTGLSDFVKNLNGVTDFSGVSNAAKAISDLVAVDIPTIGGLIDYIVGRTDWGVFGEQLSTFGPYFAQFASDVNGIETAGLPEAAEALGILLAIDPPKTDWGLIQIFTGNTSWGKFGTQLMQFGGGFKRFAQAISGISEEDLSIVGPAVNTLNTLINLDPPKQGGFFSKLIGEKSLGSFGDNIGTLGDGLKKFNDNVKDVKPLQIISIVSVLERLSNFINSLGGGADQNVENFNTAIGLLNSDTINFDQAISAIKEMETNFATSGSELAMALVDAISKGISEATDPVTSIGVLIDSLMAAIEEYDEKFDTAGTTLISYFITGLSKSSGDAITAVRDMIAKAKGEIDQCYSSFYNSGGNLAQGFVLGLGSKASAVSAAARSLAQVANYSFNSALEIKSPSRLTMRSGKYFDEGFIMGLQNGSKNVEDASKDVANSAFDSFRVAMSLVESIAENSLDFQPTIRPVIDLSNVENGVNQINSMFYKNQTIGLGGYQNPFIPNILSQINSNMNGYGATSENLQTDNSDVIQAIRDLGTEFETIKETISNMKLVMETGALVGQIKSEMDKQLGRSYFMNSRGV